LQVTAGTLTLYDTTLVNNTTSGTITYGGTVRSSQARLGATSTLSSYATLVHPLEITKAGASGGEAITTFSSTAAEGSVLELARSKSATLGTNTIVANNDLLGRLAFMGGDGTNYDAAAFILGEVDGTPGAGTDMPGRVTFWTTPDGTATPVERMRIDNAGKISSTGPIIYTPSATQAVTAVSYTILANATTIVLNPDGDYTMTSTPTIADGTTGQILYITCPAAEANIVTVQDQGTLANSNLQLGAASRALDGDNVLVLIYDGSNWCEVSYANN
jgi:hypothetical protein